MEAKPDLRSMSTKKKWEYIWDYYRFHILGSIVLIITAVSIIHHYATIKTSVLDMIFLNAYPSEEDVTPFDAFLKQQGYDTNEYEVYVTTSLGYTLTENGYQEDYYTNQGLSAMFTTGELDIFATPPQVLNAFASYGYVSDLRDLFSEEELASFGDIIIYSTLSETGEEFPSAFNLVGNEWFTENGYYDEGCYLSVTNYTNTPELTKEFILYVLNY